MAKINILFNNKDWSVDESSLSSAVASLKSHLSSVMNGSGATITLDGTSYNIDSAKLSAATNTFVSHLGTVAGSGTKVVVNGVEYNVDSSKMTGAIAQIETVLGNLYSRVNDTDVAIFPEQTLEFSINSTYNLYLSYITPAPFSLVVGETYIVQWDDEVFTCVAMDGSALVSGAVFIGDASGFGLSGNGEPFIIGGDATSGINFMSLTDTEATSHVVAIYKTTGDGSKV